MLDEQLLFGENLLLGELSKSCTLEDHSQAMHSRTGSVHGEADESLREKGQCLRFAVGTPLPLSPVMLWTIHWELPSRWKRLSRRRTPMAAPRLQVAPQGSFPEARPTKRSTGNRLAATCCRWIAYPH